jgi:hypothetical protein
MARLMAQEERTKERRLFRTVMIKHDACHGESRKQMLARLDKIAAQRAAEQGQTP